jgi:hypothetical protein
MSTKKYYCQLLDIPDSYVIGIVDIGKFGMC